MYGLDEGKRMDRVGRSEEVLHVDGSCTQKCYMWTVYTDVLHIVCTSCACSSCTQCMCTKHTVYTMPVYST